MVPRERLVEIITNVTRMFTTLCMVMLVILSIGSFGAERSVYLDWLPSFPHWFATCAVIGGLTLLALGARKRAAMAIPVFALHLVALAPWAPTLQPTPTCEPQAKAIAINAYIGNPNPDEVVRYVREQDAELVYVSELLPELFDRLEPLYPHVAGKAIYGTAGSAIFSKYPIDGYQVIGNQEEYPQIIADVVTPGGTVTVFGVHPPAPTTQEFADARNQTIRELARVAEEAEHPVLLLGDLNVTMWSPFYTPLETAGLVNARKGRGLNSTFPSKYPMRVPIDHIMHSEDVAVCDFEVGPNIASDHLPLVAEVAWPMRTTTAVASR